MCNPRLVASGCECEIGCKEVYCLVGSRLLWLIVVCTYKYLLSYWRLFAFKVKERLLKYVNYSDKTYLLLWRWTFSVSSLCLCTSSFMTARTVNTCGQVSIVHTNHRWTQQSASNQSSHKEVFDAESSCERFAVCSGNPAGGGLNHLDVHFQRPQRNSTSQSIQLQHTSDLNCQLV